MMEQIPERYSGNETLYENKYFFGTFSFEEEKVCFWSYFEKIYFDVHTMTGIPAFINYRNQHFLEFLEKADNQITYNNMLQNACNGDYGEFLRNAKQNIEEVKDYYYDMINSFCINYALKKEGMYFTENTINLNFSFYFESMRFYKSCVLDIHNIEGELTRLRDDLEKLGVLEWK